MNLREKVILGLAAAATIGGGLHFALGAGSPATAGPKTPKKDFTALITKVGVDLKKGELSTRQQQVLAAASAPWLINPLRERPLVTKAPKPTKPLPSYIGFISIGSKSIAIIDGVDYRVGEKLENGEFELARIFPDHIELLRDGATEPIKVPLEKDPTTGEPQ